MAALSGLACSVCADEGCEFCPKVTRSDLGESFPDETFHLFSDSDLEQLLVDTSKELARRQGGSWFRLGPLSDARYGGPKWYQRSEAGR